MVIKTKNIYVARFIFIYSRTVCGFADFALPGSGFENLPLRRKQLIYYLSQAALEGRDILFDQNGKYNLQIRRLLEAVYIHSKVTVPMSSFLHWKFI